MRNLKEWVGRFKRGCLKEIGTDNLCLNSPSSNSRLSYYAPADKKKIYIETERAESLKQAIMMSYKEWGPDGQGINNIESHEHAMLTLLKEHRDMTLPTRK